MAIDLREKSTQLLERVANSVHERDPKNPNLLFFSGKEVQVVEDWLREFKRECMAVDFSLKPRDTKE
jgi:hypothetical protein